MQITNNTNDDATVKVSGGGSGMVKGEEELSLPAGKSISHTPKTLGPWHVAFYVGQRQTRRTVHCATDTITLKRVGNNGFSAES